MPMISRSTPASKAGSSSISRSIGTSLVRRAEIRSSCRAPRRRPRRIGLRIAAPPPSAAPRRDACARGPRRSRDSGRSPGEQRRRPAALRRLQLHEDRAEALRQRVVNVACDAVALFEHGLPSRFEEALVDETAVVQRECRLAGRRVQQRMPPAPFALGLLRRSTARSSRASSAPGGAARPAVPSRRRHD